MSSRKVDDYTWARYVALKSQTGPRNILKGMYYWCQLLQNLTVQD